MPQVTLVCGGALLVLMTLLGVNVSRVRAQFKQFVDPAAPPKKLYVAIRAHGNFAEWVPFIVVMLLVVELAGGAKTPLWGAGIGLIVGRLLHALGLLTRLRVAPLGSAVTWGIALWLGGWAVWLGLS
ncbi:MAG: MAPEG family protein [Archangium sp.]